MRITKSKVDNEIKETINGLIEENIKVSNDITLTKDFAYDVYSLFAAEKTEKRQQFKGYWDLFMDARDLYVSLRVHGLRETLSFYNRIKDFLYSFHMTPLFRRLDELDPMEATKVFLDMFRPKERGTGSFLDESEEGENSSGQGSQADGGSLGAQGGQDQNGMSADAKNLPIDLANVPDAMAGAEQLINSGMFDDEDIKDAVAQGAGMGSAEIRLGNINELVKKIGKGLNRELIIFNVARKHEFIDVYKKSEHIDDSPVPDNDMTISQNKSINDIIRALPMEFLYDDDLFIKKLMEYSLNIIQPQSRRLKKQALYMLVDVSGSMQGSRAVYAAGVAVSLVRQAIREQSTYFLRYFDGDPKSLNVVKNREDAVKMIAELIKVPNTGGGTDFDAAIKQGIDDIRKDPNGFEEAELMIITDGDCHTSVTREDLDFIKLHSVMIAPPLNTAQNRYLESISESYTTLSRKDITDFVGEWAGYG